MSRERRKEREGEESEDEAAERGKLLPSPFDCLKTNQVDVKTLIAKRRINTFTELQHIYYTQPTRFGFFPLGSWTLDSLERIECEQKFFRLLLTYLYLGGRQSWSATCLLALSSLLFLPLT